MALLKYLKPKKQSREELLPDPEGSLSEHLSSEAIREANKEVKLVLSKESSKHSPYLRATAWEAESHHCEVRSREWYC